MERVAEKEPAGSRERTFECKVYYEDTDCMGVVYHANYLKYLERARWEFLEDRLMSILDYNERGYSFMVHKIQIVFHSPAKLGDVLVVRTWIESTTRFTVAAKQIITKKGESRDYLVTATVTFVVVGSDGQLLEVPAEFHSL
ncbi:MAG TPA: YbgC/FadM family acyl-CoA thioesterase [Desulfomonilaceae bacterium]|nr:YbgC/FadM family acyl-CoA thioesterase [Desulfomonilaceae bacterium]